MSDKQWRSLYECFGATRDGVIVRYQGTMTEERFDLLLELLTIIRNAMFGDGATEERITDER